MLMAAAGAAAEKAAGGAGAKIYQGEHIPLPPPAGCERRRRCNFATHDMACQTTECMTNMPNTCMKLFYDIEMINLNVAQASWVGGHSQEVVL